MSIRRQIIACGLVLAGGLFGAGENARASALATIETDHIKTEVVLRQSTVAPGGTAEIAIRQTIAPGWHTYWTNPGDSGEPMRLGWDLPTGAADGPIAWPAPERIPYDPLMNYGYKDTVTMLTAVDVPEDWQPGQPLPVGLSIDWLVCERICIPESGSTAFEIPTGAETTPDSTTAFLFLMAERAVPTLADFGGEARLDDEALNLTLAGIPAGTTDAYFFPAIGGLIDHAAPQDARIEGDRLALAMVPGRASPPEPLEGLIELTAAGGDRTVLQVAVPVDNVRTAEPVVAALTPPTLAPPSGTTTASGPGGVAGGGTGAGLFGGFGIFQAIAFALLGGIILNLMPCVFPVLALKALGFVRHAGEPARTRVAHGLAYTGGILVCFVALAAALLAIKAAGGAAGWGFQLQDPLVVAALAYVIFLVGLNLSGLFEFGTSLTRTGNLGGDAGGTSGSFMTGLLAAVVATPCTAPFMAVAIGFALTQGAATTLAVFLALGLGLALPFLVLSLVPGLGKRLPKPGSWMLRLKQVLAFPMYLAAAWLVWVLALQAGPNALGLILAGFVALAFGAWLFGLAQDGAFRRQRVAIAGAGAGAVASLAVLVPLATSTPSQPAVAMEAGAEARSAYAGSEAYSPARLAELRSEGRQVFLNITAAWCITCKVNEQVALVGTEFRTALAETDTVYLTGDWTRPDPEITALLESFGRAGVPLYVVYPADGGEPRVLPQILTGDSVAAALRGA